jgi:hypothetical protein
MFDTARLGTSRRTLIAAGWLGHARGFERHGAALSRVMEVVSEAPVSDVVRRYGVSRQVVQAGWAGMNEKGWPAILTVRPVRLASWILRALICWQAGRLSERFGR